MQLRFKLAVFLMFLSILTKAQTSFVASWDFENNINGSSNNVNVSVSSLGLSGVTVNALGYPTGVTGEAVSLTGWPTSSTPGDYVQVSVSPQAYRISITSVSFNFNRTTQGPTQLVVRSSMDNYSSDIGGSGVGTGYSGITINQSLTDIETTVSYRIYGYSAGAGTGALRLDNLKINGTVALVPLPVELLSFNGQHFDNQIVLNWETAWERNASHFDIQRSSSLQEFSSLQKIMANGTTKDRSRYTFTDESPLIGINYYRLSQTDADGQFVYSKIIAIKRDTNTPQLWIHENPTSKSQIKVRLYQIEPSQLTVFNGLGQTIPFQIEQNSAEDFTIKLASNIAQGYYFVSDNRVSKRVLLLD